MKQAGCGKQVSGLNVILVLSAQSVIFGLGNLPIRSGVAWHESSVSLILFASGVLGLVLYILGIRFCKNIILSRYTASMAIAIYSVMLFIITVLRLLYFSRDYLVDLEIW